MNKYELIKVIGDGTYGVVYEGKNKETREKVAIKKLKKKYKSLEECKSNTEVQVLEKLNHENIIQLKEVIRDWNGEVSYIFEYCDCNVLEFIDIHKTNKKIIPEPIIREIIMQLTKGLKYLHSKQFLHRDLKPENILLILNKYDLNNLSKNDINNSGIIVKIADFGTAKKIPSKNENTITEYICTRWYRSPECVLRADYYNETSDIWAIGCIMAELYKLGPIFPGENEFDQINQILKILGTPTKRKWPWGYSQAESLGISFSIYYKKNLKIILGYINNDGLNLLNEIFQFEANKRPSCNKILKHSYFQLDNKPSKNNVQIFMKNSINTSRARDNNNINSINSSFQANKNINGFKDININRENNNYKYRKYEQKTENKDYRVIIEYRTHKNSNANIKYDFKNNNSSSTNIRKIHGNPIISNYIKIIKDSNTKTQTNYNFKYKKKIESRNINAKQKTIEYNRITEERKVNNNNSFHEKLKKVKLINQKRDKTSYNLINLYSKGDSFANKTEKCINLNKRSITNIINTNKNNFFIINSKNTKKFNKNNIQLKNISKINNNFIEKNINKFHIYPNKINNLSFRETTTEINNSIDKNNEILKKFNNEKQYKINNFSNKRNKQRNNYKFSEIHANIKSNNNNNNNLQKIQLNSNIKECICSIGKNLKNVKRLLKNNNIKLKKNIYKIINHTQKDLLYIKTNDCLNRESIQLNHNRENNVSLYEGSISYSNHNYKREGNNISYNLINIMKNTKNKINNGFEEKK